MQLMLIILFLFRKLIFHQLKKLMKKFNIDNKMAGIVFKLLKD